jgi:uncharacterized protein (TIGR03435 family)
MRHRAGVLLVGAAIAVLCSVLVFTQPPAPIQPERRPQFEVATVRVNTSGPGRSSVSMPPGTGRLTITNMPVIELIRSAYALQLPSQLVGAPDWAGRQRVDGVAKAESPAPPAALQAMSQGLLEDRFMIAARRERRETDALALVLANKDGRPGPNLKRSDVNCDVGTTNRFALAQGQPDADRPRCGLLPGGIGRTVAVGLEMARLAALLAPSQRRVVVDRTGLTGRFDIDVTYTQSRSPRRRCHSARSPAPSPGSIRTDRRLPPRSRNRPGSDFRPRARWSTSSSSSDWSPRSKTDGRSPLADRSESGRLCPKPAESQARTAR